MSGDLSGQTLGKYKLGDVIGEGGMGTVYEGRHEALDQKVAVKVLASDLVGNPEAIARFLREGRYIAKLNHGHIVTVYDLGEERGIHYLVMEFVEGKNLSSLLERKGALKPVRALDIARQVADALAAAHEQSVIHRDIKPDNIMINRAGKVKVMDFGIAKGMDSDLQLTTEGTPIGTFRYMSPEQCRGLHVDGRSDIYSLGVVLFRMLTGQLAHPEDLGALELMNVIVEGPFPSPKDVNPAVTVAVERLVLKMTALSPGKRFESAGELAEQLRDCIRTKSYTSRVMAKFESEDEDTVLIPAPDATTVLKQRTTLLRRVEDREVLEEHSVFKARIDRMNEGKRRQRHAVRERCKALLYADCATIEDLETQGEPHPVRLLDLSSGGAAFFIEDKELPFHSRHVVEIHFEEGLVVRTPAETTWTRYIQKRGGFATGFKFADMQSGDRRRLKKALDEIRKTAGL